MSQEETIARHHFYFLKISKITHETSDTVSLTFQVEEDHKALFTYEQGQYLTLRFRINGTEYRRSYSICSAFYENELKVAVKKVDNGMVSTYLNEQLKEGDEVEVMPPQGNFNTSLDAGQSKKYIAFAAGSGITPIMSILKTTLKVEQGSRFKLIYGNRTMQDIIFREELDRLDNTHGERFELHYVLSRESAETPLFRGRIDREKLEQMEAEGNSVTGADEYFICGPEQMILSISDYLKEKGVDPSAIHYELFTTPTSANGNGAAQQAVTTETAQASDKPVSKVIIQLDGDETHIELKKDGMAILDAAIAAGIDPPYSCKGGVCTTCMARMSAGQVRMDMNHALTDGELEEGLILTCQSHPVTDEVRISYDDI